MPESDLLTPEVFDEAQRVDELQATLRRTQRALAVAKAKTDELRDAIYQAARDAAVTVGRAELPPKPNKDARKAKAEVALIHTTDWQVGKETSTFNSEIAEQRLAVELPAKIERLTDLQREAHPVREAHYLVGGDMVEGITIFPGQAWAVDSTLYEQLFHAAYILERQLLHALSIFDVVHVWEEKGNHGRLGRRGENPDGDNVDLFMYRIVQERFKNEKRIVWHNLKAPGIWNHVTIGNYSALLFHGDEIKSFGGNTPAFGILRKVTKWKSGVAPVFRDAYMGHFHTPMTLVLPDGGRIFGTGSPESDNSYATEFMAETGEPSQRIHFVDPERGRVTAEYTIWFDVDRSQVA